MLQILKISISSIYIKIVTSWPKNSENKITNLSIGEQH